MERLLIAAAIVVVVGVVALVARTRRRPDAPTQRRYSVPEQLDRADFPRPDAQWLVTVFSSATCVACAGVIERARVLETAEVAVCAIDFDEHRSLHEKYGIDAVPTLVVCDADGVTQASFLGPVNATDMWAAVAEAREPGSSPEPGLGQR
ncbi:MAG: thioredoxin family protein [Ilumatobacter sp.]|nr:thioredoxin family protein [Ilumatobacter sp.]